MRGLFSLLLSSIFNNPLERYSSQNKADHKNGNTPDAAQKRAAANPSAIGSTPISERNITTLGASLNRIWIRLKYDSELRKAASDCRKFLDALSRPRFELSTVTPLCGSLKAIGVENCEGLYEKKMNDTIKQFTREAAKNGRLEESQSNLEMNLTKFDKAREDSYNKPFRIAVEYKKALKMIKAGAPVESSWTVLKQSKS